MNDVTSFEQTTSVTLVDDLTFDVHRAGPADGEPVLLLHGFPETSLAWEQVAGRLAEAGLQVFAVDQRGYSPGARPDDVADYATGTLATDVVRIADELGLETFHLVGHDWGAAVSWVVAAEHGERLRSLTAFSVPHLAAYGWALTQDAEAAEKAAYIGLMRQAGKAEIVLLEDGARRLREMYQGRVPEDVVERYVTHFSAPGALTGALNWYRAMTADLNALPAVTVPTTYVWSDDDLAIGRAGAERCHEFVTGDYRYVELPGVSHWILEEAPDAAAEAILDRVRG